MHIPCNAANPLLGIYPMDILPKYKNSCIRTCSTTFLAIIKNLNVHQQETSEITVHPQNEVLLAVTNKGSKMTTTKFLNLGNGHMGVYYTILITFIYTYNFP